MPRRETAGLDRLLLRALNQSCFNLRERSSERCLAALSRERHGNAAPPTVYRALDFLLEQGFIHKLESINAYVSCHHPAEAHQVPFLICDSCASAQEVCDARVAELIEAQARAFGFRPQAQTLEVHGLCKQCRKG